ncbi:TPA: restriction endonuclease subunit S [Escherichia coli]|nr:restriction endonuclease subunit S [Escherichia coli]
MATYKNYQQTNLLGLEILPSHWEVKKIKHLFSIGRGRVISQAELEDEGMYPVYSSQTHNDGCLGYINSYDFNCEQITWTTDGANAGTVFLRKGKYNCTNVCGTLQPINKENFLQFHLYCLQYINQFHKRPDTNGAKIMNNEMAEVYILLPSNQEQLRITTFLDHETAKIDNLIEKQQQFIELLKEKRQAVISHAVTKGLNPDVPMKDSGVEWLGEMPEHWHFTRAKFVSNIFVPQRNKPELNDDIGIFWITMENMSQPYITSSFQYVSDVAALKSGSKILPKGAVIASCVGNFGIAAINEVDVIINQQLQAFQTLSIKADFLMALVSISKKYFEIIGTAATLAYVNKEGFENLPVVIPSENEQINICKYIRDKNKKFEILIERSMHQIELLQERRTALISAAVTGKIDLRNWTAPIAKTEAPTEASA